MCFGVLILTIKMVRFVFIVVLMTPVVTPVVTGIGFALIGDYIYKEPSK